MNPDELLQTIVDERKVAPTLAHFADRNAQSLGQCSLLQARLRAAAKMVGPGDAALLNRFADAIHDAIGSKFEPEPQGFAMRRTENEAVEMLSKFGMRVTPQRNKGEQP